MPLACSVSNLTQLPYLIWNVGYVKALQSLCTSTSGDLKTEGL